MSTTIAPASNRSSTRAAMPALYNLSQVLDFLSTEHALSSVILSLSAFLYLYSQPDQVFKIW